MLRFTKPYLAPDDVSVPCRVRRCEAATIPQQQQEIHPEEMTCTMRTWHKSSTPPTSSEFLPQQQPSTPATIDQMTSSSGLPELVLTPLYYKDPPKITFSCSSPNIPNVKRGSTPLRRGSQRFGSTRRLSIGNSPLRERASSHEYQIQQEQQLKEKIYISLDNIVKVHVNNGDVKDATKKKVKGKKTDKRRSISTKNLEEQVYKRTIGITTRLGDWYYEFTMESMNEQLVLLTFLEVNSSSKNSNRLKTPKIEFVPLSIEQGEHTADEDESGDNKQHANHGNNTNNEKNSRTFATATNDDDDENILRQIESNPSNLTQSTQQSNKSFDLEMFTAKRMKERLKRETITEKVERRMHRLSSSLEELSNSVTKCNWGCLGDSTTIVEPPTSRASFDKDPSRNTATTSSPSSSEDNDDRQKKTKMMASSQQDSRNNIEDDKIGNYDQNKTVPAVDGIDRYNMSSSSMKKNAYRANMMKVAQLPSGLSVETPDDYSEYSNSADHAGSSSVLPASQPVPVLTKAE